MARKKDYLAEALGIESNPDFVYGDLEVNKDELIKIYISSWKGNHHTEESKNAIGNANRGRKRSPEAKEKMRLAKLGKKQGPHSEEHKRRLSESLKNKGPHTEERKRNISLSKMGKKQPNVSLANKGRIPWNKGLKIEKANQNQQGT